MLGENVGRGALYPSSHPRQNPQLTLEIKKGRIVLIGGAIIIMTPCITEFLQLQGPLLSTSHFLCTAPTGGKVGIPSSKGLTCKALKLGGVLGIIQLFHIRGGTENRKFGFQDSEQLGYPLQGISEVPISSQRGLIRR